MIEYEKQAKDFCDKHCVLIHSTLIDKDRYFDDDTEERNIYLVKISRIAARDKKHTIIDKMKFNFDDSIHNTEKGVKKLSNYSILASLTKYDPGTFDNFCNDYGYDTDSRRAKKIYKAVKKEWDNVSRVFGDCLDDLREIQ